MEQPRRGQWSEKKFQTTLILVFEVIMQPPKAHFLTFSSETKIMKITHSAKIFQRNLTESQERGGQQSFTQKLSYECKLIDFCNCMPLNLKLRSADSDQISSLSLPMPAHKICGMGQIFRAQKLMFSLLAPAVITQPPCEPFINYTPGGLSPDTSSILDFI